MKKSEKSLEGKETVVEKTHPVEEVKTVDEHPKESAAVEDKYEIKDLSSGRSEPGLFDEDSSEDYDGN